MSLIIQNDTFTDFCGTSFDDKCEEIRKVDKRNIYIYSIVTRIMEYLKKDQNRVYR